MIQLASVVGINMKKLHLIRHAKSSWADASLADIQRPLNARGLKSCGIMAPHLIEAGCGFEHLFCSPARRAQATIEQLCQHLPDREMSWQLDDALYTFDSRDLLAWCRDLDEAMSEVVIVGHNPAITDLCNELSDRYIENLPTCGYAQLGYHRGLWRDLSAGTTELLSVLTPKMFR